MRIRRKRETLLRHMIFFLLAEQYLPSWFHSRLSQFKARSGAMPAADLKPSPLSVVQPKASSLHRGGTDRSSAAPTARTCLRQTSHYDVAYFFSSLDQFRLYSGSAVVRLKLCGDIDIKALFGREAA